jgi:hypothetical protein
MNSMSSRETFVLLKGITPRTYRRIFNPDEHIKPLPFVLATILYMREIHTTASGPY